MHSTFKVFSRNSETINEYIREENGKADFSTVFQHLFPNDGKFSYSMQSYLNLLHKFEFKSEFLLRKQLVVDKLYKQFSIKQPNKGGVYEFWVFLIQMYDTLTKNKLPPGTCKRPHFDNIFAFMNGFPIEKTRVVIIGQDPSKEVESSGYAFHGSDCEATHELVRHFYNNDQQFLKEKTNQPLSKKGFTGKIFNLDNWIGQGVLLFNTYLTYGEYSKELWLVFTKFLVSQLSSECNCLVFILASGHANVNFSALIDQKKHEIINVYHPTNLKQNNLCLTWKEQKPYLSANQYLYGKNKTLMIDWEIVGKHLRLEKYTTYFKTLPQIEDIEERKDHSESENSGESDNGEILEDDEDPEDNDQIEKVKKMVKPDKQKSSGDSKSSKNKISPNISPAKKRKRIE